MPLRGAPRRLGPWSMRQVRQGEACMGRIVITAAKLCRTAPIPCRGPRSSPRHTHACTAKAARSSEYAWEKAEPLTVLPGLLPNASMVVLCRRRESVACTDQAHVLTCTGQVNSKAMRDLFNAYDDNKDGSIDEGLPSADGLLLPALNSIQHLRLSQLCPTPREHRLACLQSAGALNQHASLTRQSLSFQCSPRRDIGRMTSPHAHLAEQLSGTIVVD